MPTPSRTIVLAGLVVALASEDQARLAPMSIALANAKEALDAGRRTISVNHPYARMLIGAQTDRRTAHSPASALGHE
jgi:hypothetical protein